LKACNAAPHGLVNHRPDGLRDQLRPDVPNAEDATSTIPAAADDAYQEGEIDPSFVTSHRVSPEARPEPSKTFRKKPDGHAQA
jgi:hypothetical protein